MSEEQARRTLSRRSFLKLAAAAGGTAVEGYLLYERAEWLNYSQQVEAIRRSIDRTGTASTHKRELVRYATLAASRHNTQPWRFTIAEEPIEITADYTQHVPSGASFWARL